VRPQAAYVIELDFVGFPWIPVGFPWIPFGFAWILSPQSKFFNRLRVLRGETRRAYSLLDRVKS
jgi:hypothetical protein